MTPQPADPVPPTGPPTEPPAEPHAQPAASPPAATPTAPAQGPPSADAPAPAPPRSTPAPPGLTWSLRGRTPLDIALTADGSPVTPDWAWSGSGGRGVRVCVVDSGVERDHPDVGPVDGSWVVTGDGDEPRVVPTDSGDTCGHGTACAGIIRRLAPDCELHSVRVLGERFSGTGDVLLAGLRWAVRERFDVVNLSLSTTRARFAQALHELADEAYFGGTALVASAHNTPVESFPWRFSSVFSVGSHQESGPGLHLYNPEPPVEFFAPGQNIQVAWLGGSTIRSTGNSFATPFIAGTCARVRAKHPELTLFQLKSVLYLTAANVRVDTRGAA